SLEYSGESVKYSDLSHLFSNPTTLNNTKTVLFIAEVLGYFLRPFVDFTMTLEDQLLSLCTYSFLITIIYQKNKLDFMGGALLADSQAIVKNIVFTTARLQVTAPDALYFIIQEGTDREEGLFGEVRTMDHDPNPDTIGVCHKAALATKVHSIHEQHPSLNPGHTRLKSTTAVDHTNPYSWNPNVIVSDVHLPTIYFRAKANATSLITDQFGASFIDFDAFETQLLNGTIDHLRPGGFLVGSRDCNVDVDDIDQELSESEPPTTSDTPDITTSGLHTTVANEDGDINSELDCVNAYPSPNNDHDNLDPTNFKSPSDISITDPFRSLNVIHPTDGLNAAAEAESGEWEYTDSSYQSLNSPHTSNLKEDLVGSLNPPQKESQGPNLRQYIIEDDGKLIRKDVYIARKLASTASAQKVSSRPLRNQGITKAELLLRQGRGAGGVINDDNLSESSDPQIKAFNLGALLAFCDGRIILLIGEILNFRVGSAKQNVFCISQSLLPDAQANVTVAIKILNLQYCETVDQWIWDGDYMPVQAPRPDGSLSKDHCCIRIHSTNFSVLESPRLASTSSGDATWAFPSRILQDVMQDLWLDLSPETDDFLSQSRQPSPSKSHRIAQ
ncbi:hypothetical protein CVT24_001390, partial [Panaeolus cyanescens]